MGTQSTLAALKSRHERRRAERSSTAKIGRVPDLPSGFAQVVKAVARRIKRNVRVAAGLCAFCPNKREHYACMCDACTEKHRERQRRKAALMRELESGDVEDQLGDHDESRIPAPRPGTMPDSQG